MEEPDHENAEESAEDGEEQASATESEGDEIVDQSDESDGEPTSESNEVAAEDVAEDDEEAELDGEPSEPEAEPEASPADDSPSVDPVEYTTLRGRIAAGIRDSSPLSRVRDFIFPLLTLCVLAFLLLSFRTILLPFIFACILVYLMEPIVRRIGRSPDGSGYVPRWVAVIFVYLIFIGSVGTFSVLVVPRFVTEIIRFAETVPDLVQNFRENELPSIDADVQDFLRSYLPAKQGLPDYVRAQDVVAEARQKAARDALAFGIAQTSVHHAASSTFAWENTPPRPMNQEPVENGTEIERNDPGGTGAEIEMITGEYVLVPPGDPPRRLSLDDALATNSGWSYASRHDSSIRLNPSESGGVEIFLQGVAIEVEQTSETVWTVREKQQDDIPIDESALDIEERFNLQRTLDEIIENLVTTSNARIASVIDFAQKIVVGIVGGFVAIILTLMVAAFISIDLPRVMAFLRSLVPERGRKGYDVLLERMDRGLAGVVRGQLLICVVNGIFTYIGLLILDVKFSVLLAVVAGVLSLIPVFGTIISTIPIVLIGLTDGLWTGVLALGWILLIHFVEANILNPKIIGSSAHIHPVIVIFALLAGESAFGLVGALLAVPTASILLTLFEFVRTRAWREGDPRPAE